MRIYKYQLEIINEQVLLLPPAYKILSVGAMPSGVCLWAMITPDQERVEVKIRIFGTGHDIQDDEKLDFIGTVVTIDSPLVWHIFKENA